MNEYIDNETTVNLWYIGKYTHEVQSFAVETVSTEDTERELYAFQRMRFNERKGLYSKETYATLMDIELYDTKEAACEKLRRSVDRLLNPKYCFYTAPDYVMLDKKYMKWCYGEPNINRILRAFEEEAKEVADANKQRFITDVSDDSIKFDDGTEITFDHEQDCCENNYADFEQLDDLAYGYTFFGPLKYERADGGFRFGDSRRMFYVPCYSEQNGYYTTDVCIYEDGFLKLQAEGEFIPRG